jgi:hypothetical protein
VVEALSSARDGLPLLVICALRVITSFREIVLPKLFTQPVKISTAPFGYLIL